VSEKSIRQQQAGLVRRAITSRHDHAISLGPALVAISLCRAQVKHMIRTSKRSKSEILTFNY